MGTNNKENLKKTEVSVNDGANEKKDVVKEKKSKTNIMNAKLDNKVSALLLCGVGVLCLIIGGVLTIFSVNKETESSFDNNVVGNQPDNKEDDKEKNEEELDNGTFRIFSAYKNFEIMSITHMNSAGVVLNLVQTNKYDMVSNLFYIETEFMGNHSYEYHAFDSKIVFSSSDNESWIKYTNNAMTSPVFLSTLIERVEKDDNVVKLSENSYLLDTDVSKMPNTNGYSGMVPTTVNFDSAGFITDLEFDFSEMTSTADVTITKVIYKLSNINQNVTVSIPKEVLFGAAESE